MKKKTLNPKAFLQNEFSGALKYENRIRNIVEEKVLKSETKRELKKIVEEKKGM